MTDPAGLMPPDPHKRQQRLVLAGDLVAFMVALVACVGLLLWMIGRLPWREPGIPPAATAVIDWLFELLGFYGLDVAFLLAGTALFVMFYGCLFGVSRWWSRHVE